MNTKRFFKTWELALLAALCMACLSGLWASRTHTEIADQMIRLHVLAASDSETEQAVKLEVRDAVLEDLRRQEEAKRAQVVEAKKETASIEKLREKKLESYNKAMQKSEEAMIDELVSTKRVMAAQSA